MVVIRSGLAVASVFACWGKLVEAAGVEPASEKARRAKPTCVSGSGVSAAAYKTGKSDRRLVRLISAPWLRTEARGLSCNMTLDG